jgi:hypothetical protein
MSLLGAHLDALRPALAVAAQGVYDTWDPDDDWHGGGGICDGVADAMAEVLAGALPAHVRIEAGGHEGDDHAWLVVYDDAAAFTVDIPPEVYERGAGYSWTKIPGVMICAGHVVVAPMPRAWIDDQASRVVDNS